LSAGQEGKTATSRRAHWSHRSAPQSLSADDGEVEQQTKRLCHRVDYGASAFEGIESGSQLVLDAIAILNRPNATSPLTPVSVGLERSPRTTNGLTSDG
jgi:hypothetical protein